jgi:hypothetical protein
MKNCIRRQSQEDSDSKLPDRSLVQPVPNDVKIADG